MTTEELNALNAQAEGGDVAAMNQLGQIYGGNEFKDFEKAFYWHKKAAELGNVNSMSNLGGWCYLQGNGTEKNIPLADEWLKKCVEDGGVWTWAFNELANIYANDAQYKDLNKAFYWYSKSAEAGDVLGMSNLGGWCYLWGNGTEKNLKLAVDWLGKASEQGNIWSMIRLSCDIYCQDNEYKDYTKAFTILEKVFERYFELNDTDKDYALKFVEEIAETGNVQAMLLSKEHSWDPQKQEYWTKKAAEAGDAKSQFIIAGDALYNNDIDTAIDLFIKSAKGGNADAAARLNELGTEFQFGNNCRTTNLPLAYKFYEASADCGNADGMANAAYCLSNGIGVEKDFKKCFELYSKAAELGNQFGYSNLGWCYMYGNGTEKNIPEAIKWLAKAADEFRNVWSMNRLTDIYGTFDGFINHEQAAKWFLTLIQKDCDPNSGVYENTGYNKGLYEKIKNAVLNSATEGDMLSSLSGCPAGSSLLGGAMYFTTSNAKSYINQAEEAIQRNIAYKEEQRRKAAEEEARKRAEEEKARREAEERARREREERERQERERRAEEERARREAEERAKLIEQIETDYKSSLDTPIKFKGSTFYVPDGTRRIGDNALAFCRAEEIVIPDSVTYIGKHAFREISCLKSLHIPNSVTSIGEYAFSLCQSLTSIDIPSCVTSINEATFSMTGITEIKIPNGVTHIGDWAFTACQNLKTLEFPNSLVSLGDNIVDACYSLETVIVPKGIKDMVVEKLEEADLLNMPKIVEK